MLLQLGSRAQARAPVAAPCLSLDLPTRYCCTPVFSRFASLYAGMLGHLFLNAVFFEGFLFHLPHPRQVHSLKLALEGVEKERDFYFGKLREIELLCQEHGQENDDLVQRLMEVLYASDEHVSVSRARMLVV